MSDDAGTEEAVGDAAGEGSAGGEADETVDARTAEVPPLSDRKRILVPLDGSPQATEALEYVLAEYPGEVVCLLHVIDPLEAGYATGPGPPGTGQEWYEEEKARAETLFDEARELAGDDDVTVETAIELGRPARRIVAFADEQPVDLVVMGSHGRSGVSRILLGSVAESVVRRSPVPVTIVR
ncbi:MAG: universal stress protein [Halobacteriaceae archaeon]